MALRLGTRGSKLALAQAQFVADVLGDAEVVPVKTDDGADSHAGGDKARFVRGIERALLEGEIDVAVHSAKDLPVELPDGLEIAAVPKREGATDAYCGGATSLDGIAEGARIGTSSLRRRSQLLARRPDLEVVELRGNVDTRLAKLAGGELDGVVLADAGLRRLRREDEIGFSFTPEEMVPAPGQGALVLEVRHGDPAFAAVSSANDVTSEDELIAERAAVAALGASCHTPVGVCATRSETLLTMIGFAGLPDGSEWVRDEIEGAPTEPAALGRELGERMLAAGAAEILEQAEATDMPGDSSASRPGPPDGKS